MSISLIPDLENRLKLKDFKLHALLEITKGINENQTINELLDIYHFILKEQLGFDKFALVLKQEYWEFVLKQNVKQVIKANDLYEILKKFKSVTIIDASAYPFLNQFDVVIPVYHKEKPLSFLLLKGLSRSELIQNQELVDNLSFVQTLTNIIVVAIENKRMAKDAIKQIRIQRDLELAAEMQHMLFPDDLPSDKRIDLAATYKTRHEVGGDYYDFIPINKNEFIICIADVSGKGVGAAMLMANFQATLRSLLDFKVFDLEQLIFELNAKVMKAAKGEKFITFFIGRYNALDRSFEYVNAGHNHPIVTNGKKAKFLDKGCVGLGMFDEIPFFEKEYISLDANSTIVLYTDGVVELVNKDGDYFETTRLINLIHQFYPLKMEDLNNLIFSKLDDWRGKLNLTDDTALFSCRIY